MRRRARIIHGSGRASRLDCEIDDALCDDTGEPGSIAVEITRVRRGGEYVWEIAGGESSSDEVKIRRAAQRVVDDLRASGVAAHVRIRAGGREPRDEW